MEANELTYLIRGAAFRVHTALGPGLLESIYVSALICDLSALNLQVKREVPVRCFYNQIPLDVGFRIDLLVDDQIIVEIKSIETILPVHHKQLLTYLRLYKRRFGLLINFNVADLKQGIYRKVNGY